MLQGNERIVKQKTGLPKLAEELTHVSRACRIAGLSGSEDKLPLFTPNLPLQ